MYSEKLYKQAVAYFNNEVGINIENEHVKKYAEELCYCYVQEKELITFDFWTRYEELLGQKLSYQEYLAIDSNFDLDPHDVTPEDKDVLDAWKKGWKNSLEMYRDKQKTVASITVHEMVKSYEDGDGIRNFEVVGDVLDKQAAKEVFIKERIENKHFEENGILLESDGYICSEYKDGIGFTALELVEKKISFTKAHLREFLAGLDKELLREVLKDVLPSELKVSPSRTFLEAEVPFRMEEVYGIPLTTEVRENLVDFAVENIDFCMHDYERLDLLIKNKHEALLRRQMRSFDGAIGHLCEVLNNNNDYWGAERKTEEFQPVFESEDYYGIYFYNGYNEYYLVDKETGRYELVLGDSPDFVGNYYLDKMDHQKEIHIENEEIFGWLVKYSKENIAEFADFWTDERTKGLQVLENALIENLLNNALDLLKESYTGIDFDAWVEKEVFVSQENKESALYNALVLLEKGYERNANFVSWAENEIGVSKDIMKKIGFLTEEKQGSLSLDAKMAVAKDRMSAIKKQEKDMDFERN